ncbi:MAG: histidine triad nucleotide-binding protein [Deltaproteobacteria bacterium]|nr:histidine triad nucleotide-binding protein [Deltaproteobacteria bacterium]
MNKSCLFCKIVEGTVPSDKVYETKEVFAFRDIHPKAPVHILIVPKIHLTSLAEIHEKNVTILNPLFLAAVHLAKENGILDRGFRTVFNCNPEGGQMVYHLHLHLLGGRPLGGAMGA